MSPAILLILIVSAGCAAAGQVFFKLGAMGRTSTLEFLNLYIGLGFIFYVAGTILWILALSKAPLNAVYPFTAVTYVLVFISAAVFLQEEISLGAAMGSALVVLGLGLVYLGSRQ